MNLGGAMADFDDKKNSATSKAIIFLVEDRSTQAELIVLLLNKIGFNKVRVFLDANSALEAFHDNPEAVDMIISDFNMPEMSGVDLLIAVRTSKFNNKVPFVIISGIHNTKAALTASHHGADAFIAKPFDHYKLAEKIKPLLLHQSVSLT